MADDLFFTCNYNLAKIGMVCQKGKIFDTVLMEFSPQDVMTWKHAFDEMQKVRPIRMNKSVLKQDIPRLSKQCKKILQLFKDQIYVSTIELSDIAKQYNARVYELRKAGYKIKMVETGKNGVNLYSLIRSGQQQTLFKE